MYLLIRSKDIMQCCRTTIRFLARTILMANGDPLLSLAYQKVSTIRYAIKFGQSLVLTIRYQKLCT